MSDDLPTVAQELLEASGRGPFVSLEPFVGGRNNRVYRVHCRDATGVLKHYYQGPSGLGGRDRFATEVAWYNYFQTRVASWIPAVWGISHASRCVLFEELPGRRPTVMDISANAVQQAAEFVAELNRDRAGPEAAALPLAAESAFSLEDHARTIQSRLDRLGSLAPDDDLDVTMQGWLRDVLTPIWFEACRRLLSPSISAGTSAEQLSRNRWCLSPSDFGFHNSLITYDGRLRFLDFEYAGWDDPAKLVADFYWQVDLPAPRETWRTMVHVFDAQELWLTDRLAKLFPAQGIKWCAILLNEFVRAERQRREFAGHPLAEDRRALQWDRARSVAHDVESLLSQTSSLPFI